MVAQNKGKLLEDIALSQLTLHKEPYFASIKYDGHYVQIHKDKTNEVKFFTSGGKQFYIESIADSIKQMKDFSGFIEAEFIADSLGLLGDRGEAAKLTTYRTDFCKGIKTIIPSTYKFKVFDIITDLNKDRFDYRMHMLEKIAQLNNPNLEICQYKLLMCNNDLQDLKTDIFEKGYEGLILKAGSHIYKPNKRTNDIIKIKKRKTKDLVCIGFTLGEGKYSGMIGSLLLEDSLGKRVSVGSGLDDNDRHQAPEFYFNRVIEIEYEQETDITYIQPTFVCVRFDKYIGD